MANTYTLIASSTAGAGGVANIEFTSIPSTYTDLLVKLSLRTEGVGNPYLYCRFNGSTTGYSNRRIIGDGSAVSSSAPADAYILVGICNSSDQTSNTFSSHDLYIPNYASSNYKSTSTDAVTENNATAARAVLFAGLWSNTAAITYFFFNIFGGYF